MHRRPAVAPTTSNRRGLRFGRPTTARFTESQHAAAVLINWAYGPRPAGLRCTPSLLSQSGCAFAAASQFTRTAFGCALITAGNIALFGGSHGRSMWLFT